MDSFSADAAISCGGGYIAYLADSLVRRIRGRDILKALQEGRVLLLSSVNPDAGFSAGIAMARNRYIYAQSEGTVVVRSDYKKGGTWSGAVDSIKHGICPVYCRSKPEYTGNTELIKLGAIPVDDTWDAVLSKPSEDKAAEPIQLTLSDFM